MSGDEGGALVRRPRVYIDHFQIAVEDLDTAAVLFEHEYGLSSIPGGRHPGRGTANRIIPLGSDYLELIAVVDSAEAAKLPTSQRVADAIAGRHRFATWAVRTDDLAAMRRYLGSAGFDLPPISRGARTRPDGVTLEWQMQETVKDATPSPLPFLIQWSLPEGMYPGAAPIRHRSGARRIAAVRLADPHPERSMERLRTLLGDDIDFRLESAPHAGVRAVELETPSGRMMLG